MGEFIGTYQPDNHIEGAALPERREIPVSDAKYLAGIFEMGGGMSMRPKSNLRYTKDKWPLDIVVTAKAYFNDNDEEVINGLKQTFGGLVAKIPRKNSWRWIVQDFAATELLEQIRPYAPFRAGQIGAFTTLYDGITIDNQLDVAEQFTEYVHGLKDYPNPDVYKNLMKDGDFLRGVYRARGAQYSYATDNMLRFNSQNISLMNALGQEFGMEPLPILGSQTNRDSQTPVPVSFILDLRNSTREHFLERIAIPAA